MAVRTRSLVILSICSFALWFIGCSSTPVSNKPANQPAQQKKIPQKIRSQIETLEPFFNKMGKPEPGDWLSSFKEEGQTFEQYFVSDPVVPSQTRNKLYIRPIGTFTPAELDLMKNASEMLELFFGLETTIMRPEKFPTSMSYKNWRNHKVTKQRQIRTGWILDELLAPNLPENAAAMICFTNEDLYPSDNFNFVFGQASLKARVGVWSFIRLREGASKSEFTKRVLKLAIHETGHMFSIAHCTKYSCAMNGSNHLQESDRRPLDFCPEDSAKVAWFRDSDMAKRYTALSSFMKRLDLESESVDFKKKADAFEAKQVN